MFLLLLFLHLFLQFTAAFNSHPFLLHRNSFQPLRAGKGFGSPKSSDEPPFTPIPTPIPTPTPTTLPSKPVKPRNPALKAMEDAENLKRVNLKNEIANLKQIDLQVAESPASIPEDVASTMLSRMVPYVGIPMTLAASSFGFFYYQAKYQDTQYDTILVATVTVGFLVVGLLGITYSLFSANWDGDGGGSVDDFKQNLGSVQQGLRRGLIDNPKLREEALNMEENEENVDLETLNRARRREREGKGRKS